MADGTRPALGLSIGQTSLAAVHAGGALTRRPVLTLYPRRPPEVGVPSENPRLTGRGLVLSGFVERVADPAGVVAADGSRRRGETLLATALRALAYTATDGYALPTVAVSYPAHWSSAAVEALRAALSRVPEWSPDRRPVWLLPDGVAALTALHADPGVPGHGIIAVCDFGGSGTGITVVDAADDYRPLGATVRHTDFSGAFIDQALLAHALDESWAAGSFEARGPSSIGPLNRLRAGCRIAKEELSSSAAATVSVELPGHRGGIRLTRDELDEVIRARAHAVVAFVQETLQRNGTSASDLVAVAAVGGGANIPLITTMFSERLGVPVITAARPHLAAAVGAALRAAHGGGALSARTGGRSAPAGADGPVIPSPRPTSQDSRPGRSRRPDGMWLQRRVEVILGAALVVLAIGAAIVIALHHL